MAHPPTCTTADFFVLRIPSLPLNALGLGRLDAQGAGENPSMGVAFAEERSAFRQGLRHLLLRKEVRAAIDLASPDLAAQIPAWLDQSLRDKDAQRVEHALIKYLSRMSSRSTPFGLFAGVATGTWDRASALTLGSLREGRTIARLDWGLLESIVRRIEREPVVREGLIYRPNSSLYRHGASYRYQERRDDEKEVASYHLESVEVTTHLQCVLERAAQGAQLNELGEDLQAEGGVQKEEALAFLNTLVDAQVLVSNLNPPLSSPDPLGHVAAILGGVPGAGVLVAFLEGIGREVRSVEALPVDAFQGWRKQLAERLAEAGFFPKGGDLVQIDLHRGGSHLRLSKAMAQAFIEGVELLRRLSPPPAEGPLARFCSSFSERYGDQWMPLLEALDEESGIGFDGVTPKDSSLLEGVPLVRGVRSKELTPRDQYLLRQLSRWHGNLIWELDEQDLEGLANPTPEPFAKSFAALTRLSASSLEALDRGEFKFWMGQYSGPTAARWLGRFANGDQALSDALKSHLHREEASYPEALFAEVVHSPEGRMGNVLARPCLRGYEIPFLANAGVPDERVLQPSDLLVTVRRGRVFLASRRLGREVIPRLSSAHNFKHGPVVYRFLAHLQNQDGHPGGWSWGALADLPFLPRVSHGRQVLSKARWLLQHEELKAAIKATGDQPWEAFQSLRERRGLPRWVLLSDADNELLVDLDQVNRVETLHHLVAHRAQFTLSECFTDPDKAVVTSAEGEYAHELVIPFEALEPPRRPQAPLEHLPVAAQTRRFAPGFEWLYLKLYCGTATADRVLKDLEPLLWLTKAEGLWDQWHFVRYRDPEHHLRLRFHGEPLRLMSALLPRILSLLEEIQAHGVIWKTQVDTFEPEVERYGGRLGVDLATQWFEFDSQQVMGQIGSSLPEGDRWKSGLMEVDALWTALGFDLPGRSALAKASRDAFRKEFTGAGGPLPQVGQRYRFFRKELEALLKGRQDPDHHPRFEPLRMIRDLNSHGKLIGDIESIACSLAHMHLNRLFRSDPREQEWLLMEFLGRWYESQLSRPSCGSPGAHPRTITNSPAL